MAHAVFRHKVAAAGLTDRIAIDSAGTGNWHAGQAAHKGTRAILHGKGVSAAGLIARQITGDDLATYDYILTMDEANLSDVRALGPTRAVVQPLLSYAPHLGTEVPDPYYDGRFAHVYDLVDEACDALLAAIRRIHNL